MLEEGTTGCADRVVVDSKYTGGKFQEVYLEEVRKFRDDVTIVY